MGCVFKNILSVKKVSERGIPFGKIGCFPNCPPGMSQIGNSLPKTSGLLLNTNSQDGPLEIII